MLKLIIVGTICAMANAYTHPVNSQIVNSVRTRTTKWVAHDVETNPLRNYSMEKLKGMLGTILDVSEEDDQATADEKVLANLPHEFDWRSETPNCVHSIRDQQQCGSCWAFAASEALSDRFCIASKGAVNVVLSPQDMVSCDNWDMGCNGGILPWAWSFLTSTGVAADDCVPYVSGNGKVTACSKKCDDGSAKQIYKCAKSTTVKSTSVDTVKSDILANGPVETGFTVYEDFFSYKSGVYHYTSGEKAGGHAVKIVGWGYEGNTGYWICANSWGTSWGEDGFFKIEFNNCGINDATYGCTPQL